MSLKIWVAKSLFVKTTLCWIFFREFFYLWVSQYHTVFCGFTIWHNFGRPATFWSNSFQEFNSLSRNQPVNISQKLTNVCTLSRSYQSVSFNEIVKWAAICPLEIYRFKLQKHAVILHNSFLSCKCRSRNQPVAECTKNAIFLKRKSFCS